VDVIVPEADDAPIKSEVTRSWNVARQGAGRNEFGDQN